MLGTIFLGMIAGWIAGLVMRGSGFGVIADIIIGLVGAVVGRWIFSFIGASPHGRLADLAMSVFGAVVLVARRPRSGSLALGLSAFSTTINLAFMSMHTNAVLMKRVRWFRMGRT